MHIVVQAQVEKCKGRAYMEGPFLQLIVGQMIGNGLTSLENT